MSKRLVFLKLGGSLITDKNQAHTPRLEMMDRLAGEVFEALQADPDLSIVLGHGSGSFGHVPASKYKTRQGVRTQAEWQGFVEVWREAADLNHLVLRALAKAGLPAFAIPPSAAVTARQGQVETWDLQPLRHALERGLLPVINGDTVFDKVLGGTILSTEDLFGYLAGQLQPTSILLAGIEPGVWADFPENTRLLPEITPQLLEQVSGRLMGSAAPDVTGGMADKVSQVISMVKKNPAVKASIFSGKQAGNVRRELLGEVTGTLIHA